MRSHATTLWNSLPCMPTSDVCVGRRPALTRGTTNRKSPCSGLTQETCELVEELFMVEDVIVPRAGNAQEALRFRSCREQALAELIRHDLVTIAMGGEERHLDSARQREAIEAVAGKRSERAIVT